MRSSMVICKIPFRRGLVYIRQTKCTHKVYTKEHVKYRNLKYTSTAQQYGDNRFGFFSVKIIQRCRFIFNLDFWKADDIVKNSVSLVNDISTTLHFSEIWKRLFNFVILIFIFN